MEGVVEADDSWIGSTGTRLDEDGRFLGVLGYAPRHYDSAAALMEEHGDRLRALHGKRLDRSFVVWEPDEIEEPWFVDGPLILDFGDTRLEMAAFKMHLCVGWDLIDVAEPIVWGDFRLEWREDALPELARLSGRIIDEVRLVEYEGMLNGVQLVAGDARAEVFNALDEWGITGS
jgi:hypothetical protein